MAKQATRPIIENDDAITRILFLDRNILEETNIQEIGTEIAGVVDRSPNPKLLIVFENVEHLFSAALGMLITINSKIRQKGGQLRLSNIDPQILEVFAITRLNNLFQIFEQAEEAVESFQ